MVCSALKVWTSSAMIGWTLMPFQKLWLLLWSCASTRRSAYYISSSSLPQAQRQPFLQTLPVTRNHKLTQVYTIQARTCFRLGAVSSMDVAVRMLVVSSVSDLLRSTLRVAEYNAMFDGSLHQQYVERERRCEQKDEKRNS